MRNMYMFVHAKNGAVYIHVYIMFICRCDSFGVVCYEISPVVKFIPRLYTFMADLAACMMCEQLQCIFLCMVLHYTSVHTSISHVYTCKCVNVLIQNCYLSTTMKYIIYRHTNMRSQHRPWSTKMYVYRIRDKISQPQFPWLQTTIITLLQRTRFCQYIYMYTPYNTVNADTIYQLCIHWLYHTCKQHAKLCWCNIYVVLLIN